MTKLISRHQYDLSIMRWTSEQRDTYLSKLDRTWLVNGVIVTGPADIIADLFIGIKPVKI